MQTFSCLICPAYYLYIKMCQTNESPFSYHQNITHQRKLVKFRICQQTPLGRCMELCSHCQTTLYGILVTVKHGYFRPARNRAQKSRHKDKTIWIKKLERKTGWRGLEFPIPKYAIECVRILGNPCPVMFGLRKVVGQGYFRILPRRICANVIMRFPNPSKFWYCGNTYAFRMHIQHIIEVLIINNANNTIIITIIS